MFVAFTVTVLLLPAVTEPKSTLAAPSDNVPATVCEFDLLVLTPAQPSIPARQAKTIPTWLIRFTVFAQAALGKNVIVFLYPGGRNSVPAINESGLKTLCRIDCRGT